MRNTFVLSALLLAASIPWQANASTYSFSFAGPGVSGSVVLTYGTATDEKYPGLGFEITGISGNFSDSNNGLNIVNEAIGDLVPITHDQPEKGNTLAPHDFSRYKVAQGLSHGVLTFDNLYWPFGSPQTANDYPFHGGIFDIYGLMFTLDDGKVVDLWSNGDMGTGHIDYGVAVATHDLAYDYVNGGVSVSPEPGTVALLGGGLLGLLIWRRRATLGRS